MFTNVSPRRLINPSLDTGYVSPVFAALDP
jgi:hypothetical protein